MFCDFLRMTFCEFHHHAFFHKMKCLALTAASEKSELALCKWGAWSEPAVARRWKPASAPTQTWIPVRTVRTSVWSAAIQQSPKQTNKQRQTIKVQTRHSTWIMKCFLKGNSLHHYTTLSWWHGFYFVVSVCFFPPESLSEIRVYFYPTAKKNIFSLSMEF